MSVDLAELYRDLHQHPELSLQEFRTAAVLADALRSLGFEVTTGVGDTGVVGELGRGSRDMVDDGLFDRFGTAAGAGPRGRRPRMVFTRMSPYHGLNTSHSFVL